MHRTQRSATRRNARWHHTALRGVRQAVGQFKIVYYMSRMLSFCCKSFTLSFKVLNISFRIKVFFCKVEKAGGTEGRRRGDTILYYNIIYTIYYILYTIYYTLYYVRYTMYNKVH